LALKAQPATSDPSYDGTTLHYLTGGISTYGHYTPTYGYFEASMQLPTGQGMWPAFWLYDAGYSTEEFDVIEELDGQSITYQTAHQTSSTPQQQDVYSDPFNPTSGFHRYGLLWTPSGTTWYVDGVPGLQTSISDSKPMEIIINNAVGTSSSWPGAPNSSTSWPQTLYVRYLRGYSATSNSC